MGFGDEGSSVDGFLFFVGLAADEYFFSPDLQSQTDQIFFIISSIPFILDDAHKGNRFFMILYFEILLFVFR